MIIYVPRSVNVTVSVDKHSKAKIIGLADVLLATVTYLSYLIGTNLFLDDYCFK